MKALRYLLYFAIPVGVAFVTFQILYRTFFVPFDPNGTPHYVQISDDLDFEGICKKLVEAKIIRNTRSLCLYARWKGDLKPIRPGEYELSAAMKPEQILEALESGKVHKRFIMIEPGQSVWTIGEVVEKVGLNTRKEFDHALTDPKLLAAAGISSSSFEGYLAPGEYALTRPISARDIVWAMLERAEKNWTEEYSAKADELRMSRHEVLTLASIIEKTTKVPSEKKLVSSVLHNRLNHGMKLQSDETVIYGLQDFSGTLSEEDRASPSPYNTYMNYGLPPGPITNPTEESIRAALFPDDTSYLFFARDQFGDLVFSETLKEHNAVVGNSKMQNEGP
ncbi:MAG: endolytic transglycosylase MltG [Bdellovibrionales bacterium]|nr:endolytic transglycosylase MltG [Bdellovibrionales bacterium]